MERGDDLAARGEKIDIEIVKARTGEKYGGLMNDRSKCHEMLTGE